jgi:hypothetical protein
LKWEPKLIFKVVLRAEILNATEKNGKLEDLYWGQATSPDHHNTLIQRENYDSMGQGGPGTCREPLI